MVAALDGVKVIDFSRHMSAPYGTVVLGDFGADVVKVESVPDGDPSRRTGTAFVNGESGLFLQWNRSKRSLAVDMRRPEGLDVVKRLVADADVLVENYRPGVADTIGIGYAAMAEVNPRLIYCSVSAFGPDGPIARHPGTDPVIQAMSGVMSLTGEPDGGPLLVGIPIADFTGAMTMVQGILLALLAREKTGQGQRVDVPMLSALVFGLTTRLASYWADGKDPTRHGAAHSVVAPYQVYATADGQVVAGAWAPEAWPRFCRALDRMDLVDDPRFASNVDRVAHRDELNAIVGKAFLERTTAEWQERFEAAQALFGPVYTVAGALDQPQMEHLGMVETIDHPTAGPVSQLAPPILLSRTPGAIRRPPPRLGEHSAEVLTAAGYDAAAIDDLRRRGIVVVAEGD